MPTICYINLTFSLILSCFISQKVIAQEKQTPSFWDFKRYTENDIPRIYTSMGFLCYNSFANGNPSAGLQNLQAGIHIEHSNFGISFHFGTRNRRALEIPNDYIPSEGGGLVEMQKLIHLIC